MTTMQSTAKRHWVATLITVWMVGDALVTLLWEAERRYSVWRLLHRAQIPPPPAWPFWMRAMSYNLRGLLDLLPSPHLFVVLYDAVIAPSLHLRQTFSLLPGSLLNLTEFGIAITMGYGIFQMRQWARWGYAGLCVLSLVMSILMGWALSFNPFLAIYRLMGLILPIVLLVFLVRRGLVAQTREAPRSPSQ